MELTDYPVPHAQVAARIVDDAAVIVLADAGEVNVLNPVGTRIWELVDGTHSVQEIIATIAAEYAVSAEDAARDVEEFLQQLVEAQAVVLEPHA